MSRKSLIIWGIVALAAAVFAWFTFPTTFPEAALDLKISRQQAAERARQFVESQGFDLSEYKNAQSFYADSDTRFFLEKKLNPAEANRLISADAMIWMWGNRWFKELQQEEFYVDIAPDGRLITWWHEISEDAPGQSLSADEAQQVAERWLHENSVALDGYEIADTQVEELPNRTDHDIVWKLSGFDCHGATKRIWVRVAGSEVNRFSRYLQLPESWAVEQDHNDSYKALLYALAYVGQLALSVAMLIVLAIGLRRGGMRFRFVWPIFALMALIVLLQSVNSLQQDWMDYETTSTVAAFWAKKFVTVFVALVIVLLSMVLLLPSSDWLMRRIWPERVPLSRIASRTFWRTRPAVLAVVVGLCLAALHLAYVSAFYFGARRIGAWVPQDEPAINALATAMPWLMPLQTGLSAALFEEITFRLFAVALSVRLTKRAWPGLILGALVWAFLHSTYAQEPFYIRGLELTVVGIAYGLVFLRYGIVATLVAHYTFNATSTGVGIVAAGGAYLTVTGLAAMAAALFLLLPALRLKLRREKLPDLHYAEPSPQQAPQPEELPLPLPQPPLPQYKPYAPMPVRGMWVLAAIAAVGIAVGMAAATFEPAPKFGDYVQMSLNKQQANQIADRFLRDRNVDPEDYRCVVDFDNNLGGRGADYIWEVTESLDAMNEIFKMYNLDAVYWGVHYFKPLDREGHYVYISPNGDICGYYHAIDEEAAGADLPQDEAKALAEKYLREENRVDLDQYRLIFSDSTEEPARTDHRFTWEHAAAEVGECKFRVGAHVQGAEPHNVRWFFHLPEQWTRARQRESTVRILLSLLLVPIPILFFWRFLRLYAQKRMMPFRLALALAAVPAILILLHEVLTIENLWMGYDVDVSPRVFLAGRFLYGFGIQTVLVWLVSAFLIMAADAFYRDAFPNQIPPLCWLGLRRWRHSLPKLPMGLVWGEAILSGTLACYAFGVNPDWLTVADRALGLGSRPHSDITAHLTSWPALDGAAAAINEGIIFVLVMLIVVSLVYRYFWRKIWLVAFCFVFLGAALLQFKPITEYLTLTMIIVGFGGYALAKWVFRGNMAAVLSFVLFVFMIGTAGKLILSDNAHVRLNGLMLLVPLALYLMAGIVLYVRGHRRLKQAAQQPQEALTLEIQTE